MILNDTLKEIPYWLDPPILTKDFTGKPLPDKTDVLVIGSGYTGITVCAINYHE
jgi:hypothetical protein